MSERPVLQIMVGSTRPGRVGLTVARWVEQQATEHGGFELDFVDLQELALPFFDEPKHPRLGDYQHAHTKAWSARVARADAFVWVIPEYNYSFTAPVKNALDYLHAEWSYKPIGFVSYGGIAAGTRAVQLLKPVVTTLRISPVGEGVPIPFVANHIADGVFTGTDSQARATQAMLSELQRVSAALAPLRA